MKKHYIGLILLIMASNAFCLMRGSGDLLHPLSITKISVNKASINIDYDFIQSEWLVNVIYEFENPEDKELMKLSKDELKILRNSIYAWYGYEFKDSYLNEYFKEKCWYWPNKNADIQFNNIEKQNIESIIKIEKEKEK